MGTVDIKTVECKTEDICQPFIGRNVLLDRQFIHVPQGKAFTVRTKVGKTIKKIKEKEMNFAEVLFLRT